MNPKHTLLFRLDGPMQSWGYRSRFDYRDTALEPTRSGVVGLIAAAMGIPRHEDISWFDTVRMGVRVDKPGKPERDYQTSLHVIRASGSGDDTVVSRRDFLADAAFTVGLESEDVGLLSRIADSLCDPVWVLYLGRKAFPLATPPLRPGEAPMLGTLEEHLFRGDSDRRVVLESSAGERVQNDWPVGLAERTFKPRQVHTCFEGRGGSQ